MLFACDWLQHLLTHLQEAKHMYANQDKTIKHKNTDNLQLINVSFCRPNYHICAYIAMTAFTNHSYTPADPHTPFSEHI